MAHHTRTRRDSRPPGTVSAVKTVRNRRQVHEGKQPALGAQPQERKYLSFVKTSYSFERGFQAGRGRYPLIMLACVIRALRLLTVLAGGHRALALENLALRQQLAIYRRARPRPAVRGSDRLFWVSLRAAVQETAAQFGTFNNRR